MTGNYSQAKKEIISSIKARNPFLIIDSFERTRVIDLFTDAAKELNREIDFYTENKQFFGLLDPKKRASANGAPLMFIEDALKNKSGQVFVLGDFRYIDSDNNFSRQMINLIYAARENKCTIAVVTSENVWHRLSQLGIYISLALPDLEERVEYIRNFVKKNAKVGIDLAAKDFFAAATMLAGFSEIQLDILLSSAMVSEGGLTLANIHEISKKKSKIYGRVTGVEYIQPDSVQEAAGLERLKDWLRAKKQIFFAEDKALRERGLTAPKGILLGGVPGCGKSLSAKMVAKDWQLPLYRFDIGSLYDKYIGESEKNMRAALSYIDNVSPCVLWVDEIEKMLAVSDNGNDTAKRILGAFLYWLQESKSRVFLIATANEVSLLPAELFRKGRFSEIFFLGLPTRCERLAAIRLYARSCLKRTLSNAEEESLTVISEGFSFADIETAIKDSAEAAIIHGQEILKPEFVAEKFKATVSISQSAPELVARIYKWGSESAVQASAPDEDSV